MSTIHEFETRRASRQAPKPADRKPAVSYRFPVRDEATGEIYYVVIGDDGLAYREVAEPLRAAV